jgi:CheY-like chemotaxis protein
VEKPFVLLADDNEATCTLIKALLQNDFLVDSANNGMEAVEKLKSRQYSAILLDLLMPGSDGFAVLDFLKHNRPDLLPSVIVVTASLMKHQTERVEAYGVCQIIAKPFDIDALHGAVKRCSGLHEGGSPRGPILSSGMILLLADLLRRV